MSDISDYIKRSTDQLSTTKQSSTSVQPTSEVAEFLATNPNAQPTPQKESAKTPSFGAAVYKAIVDSLPPGYELGQKGKQLTDTSTDHGAGASAVSSALDVGSFGTIDRLMAFDHAMRNLGGEESFSDSIATQQEAINLGLAKQRMDHGTAALAGGVAGGLLSGTALGGPISSLVRGGTWATKTALAIGLGGLEGGLYRYNSDGTPEEIGRDSAIGAVGSGLFSLAGSLIGGGLKRIVGGNTTNAEKLAATELLDAINIAKRGDGKAGISMKDLVSAMQKHGPDTIVADVYPELKNYARLVMTDATDGAGVQSLAKVLRFRNLQTEYFADGIDDALKIPGMRTQAQFFSDIATRQKALGPQYDAVLDGAESAGVSFKAKPLIQNARKALEVDGKLYTDEGRNTLKQFTNIINKLSRKKPDPRYKPDTQTLSMRELHNAKVKLGDMIAARRKTPAGKSKKPTQYLSRLYHQLDNFLAQNSDEYASLSAVYGDAHSQRNAFAAGYKMFGDAKTMSDEVIDTLGNAKSLAEVSAFIHGTRRKLYEEVSKLKTPKAVEAYFTNNQGKMRNLEAVVGADVANRIKASAVAAARKEATKRTLNAATDAVKVKTSLSGGESVDTMADFLIAVQNREQPAGKRAVAKLLNKGKPTKAKVDAAADVMGKALSAPAAEMDNITKWLTTVGKYGTDLGAASRGAAKTAGVFTGLHSPTRNAGYSQEQEAVNIQQYLDSLQKLTR